MEYNKYNLKISNFQSIKNQELDLYGFTVICGASDLGKSALRRAMQTALFNNWSKAYIRNGSKKTNIKISLNEGKDNKGFEIQVSKSGDVNSFNINGISHNKMGKNIPEIPEFRFVESLNIATQLEPLFMVAYKDTENTKILNKLFSIDVLELAQQFCLTDLRRAKLDYNKSSEMLDRKRKEYEISKDKYNKIKEINDRYLDCSRLIDIIKSYLENKESLESYKDKIEPIKEDLSKVNKSLDVIESYVSLRSYLASLKRHRSYQKELDLKSVSLGKIKVNLDELEGISNKLFDLRDYLNSYHTLQSLKEGKVENTLKSIKDISCLIPLHKYLKAYNNLEDLYNNKRNIRVELDEINNKLGGLVCPTCNRLFGGGNGLVIDNEVVQYCVDPAKINTDGVLKVEFEKSFWEDI